jgi:molecular chaperone Hsp33
MSVLERAASAEVVDDIVLPFAVESLSTRGRLVRLGPAIDLLLKRHDYPEAVSKLVAEAVTLTALLGSNLKTGGRFHHASGRFRRAVEFAGAGSFRQGAP